MEQDSEVVDGSLKASYTEQEAREAQEIINRGQLFVNSIKVPIVEISVVPGEESDASLLNFSWNCTKVTDSYIEIQMLYDHEEEVSIYDYKEKLKVKFFGFKYFAASDG